MKIIVAGQDRSQDMAGRLAAGVDALQRHPDAPEFLPPRHGFDEYFDDLNERYERGEFEVSDSIHFADSLKFKTKAGRIVYGGGGIMPDQFVPYDTTGLTAYFIRVRPLIYQFALSFTENNRDVLKKFSEAGELEKHLDRQTLLDQFTRYTAANKIKADPTDLAISGRLIHIQLKAYIARNILDNKGFYPIWEELDTTLKYAIGFLGKKE